jgi:hypothetical protein
MGAAASKDKYPEGSKHPVEGEITPFADKVDERDRNRQIGEGDHRVRNNICPQQLWYPQIAMSVGHESVIAQ